MKQPQKKLTPAEQLSAILASGDASSIRSALATLNFVHDRLIPTQKESR
jgi:hypothetical protein